MNNVKQLFIAFCLFLEISISSWATNEAPQNIYIMPEDTSCRNLLTQITSIEPLDERARLKLIDNYLGQVEAAFTKMQDTASRISGVTITGLTMNSITVRMRETVTPSWAAAFESASTLQFGVSSNRTPREKVYAEYIFVKNKLDYIAYLIKYTNFRSSDYAYKRLLDRQRNLVYRKEELERWLR